MTEHLIGRRVTWTLHRGRLAGVARTGRVIRQYRPHDPVYIIEPDDGRTKVDNYHGCPALARHAFTLIDEIAEGSAEG